MQGLAKQSIHIMNTHTEARLCSFGNYLLSRYGVMVHSTDGKNTPIYQREVSSADLANWEHEWNQQSGMPEQTLLPSQFDIGEKVIFSINQSFGDNPFPYTAEVLAVHFYEGKVKYDLSIPIYGEPPTRIYNIDSCFVLPKEKEASQA